MDHIKEENEEFKLEKMESIDVDENNDDFKFSLHDQYIKLEKQDLIYDLKQDVLDVKDTEFKLNSLAYVKEEVDTDSHYQVSNYTTTSMNPYLKDDSKLTYGLLEEKSSTSTVNFKCLVGEGLCSEVSPTASDKQFEEQISILSTTKEENSSNIDRVCDNKIKS
ncbi:hypothetical protein C0J52_18797 [Blattella germanica]|nr:hypothetical protein C0J52_18797 [Blattella germanica]